MAEEVKGDDDNLPVLSADSSGCSEKECPLATVLKSLGVQTDGTAPTLKLKISQDPDNPGAGSIVSAGIAYVRSDTGEHAVIVLEDPQGTVRRFTEHINETVEDEK